MLPLPCTHSFRHETTRSKRAQSANRIVTSQLLDLSLHQRISVGVGHRVRGKLGLPVERDLHFDADKTLSAYADDARTRGHIVA